MMLLLALTLVVGIAAEPMAVTCDQRLDGCVSGLSSAATAQDAAPHSQTPTVLLESYYNHQLLDVIPGGRFFRAHAVPVLQEFVEAGSVYAWYLAEMPIGSASNVYFAVVLRDSLALAEFRQFLPRVAQRAGAVWDTLGHLMTPEREELWEIVTIRTPSPAAEATWLQHRLFEVSTAQVDSWRGFLDEVTTPVRKRSMDAGVLDGWIQLRRLDGDRHTWKFLEWYGGWGDIEAFGESFFAALAADVQRATDWARGIERLRLEIWRYLPRNSRRMPGA
jgi:hypothetical protein